MCIVYNNVTYHDRITPERHQSDQQHHHRDDPRELLLVVRSSSNRQHGFFWFVVYIEYLWYCLLFVALLVCFMCC